MKRILLTVLGAQLVATLAVAGPRPVTETTEGGRARVTTYTSTVRYGVPLTTTEGCSGPNPARLNTDVSYEQMNGYYDTPAGYRSYVGAAEEALATCRNDMNADCKIVSARYRQYRSHEFIGYKACEAIVQVRGYKF